MTYEHDPNYTKWIDSSDSERTRGNYRRAFKKWSMFVKKSPSQQIEERRKQVRSEDPITQRTYETLLVEFMKSLESETKNNEERFTSVSIHDYVQRIMSFFSYHHLPLQFRKGELRPRLAEREKVKSLKWIPNKTELRQMYKRANLDDRARLLTLAQSGFSPVDMCSLCIEHFPNLFTIKEHHYIAKTREKTKIVQQTALSIEAIHDIRLLLEKRDNPKKGWLFTTKKHNQLTPRFLNEQMSKLAKQVFPDREFKTHHLRDSFKNGLIRAKLPTELIDVLFGHKRSGSKSNYQLTEQTVMEAYGQAFEYLSINGTLQSHQDIEALRQEIREMKEKYELLATIQQTLLKTIEEQRSTKTK